MHPPQDQENKPEICPLQQRISPRSSIPPVTQYRAGESGNYLIRARDEALFDFVNEEYSVRDYAQSMGAVCKSFDEILQKGKLENVDR